MKKLIIFSILILCICISIFSKEIFLWRYMVEPGDTLYKISRFFATQPEILVKRNGFTNPEKLSVGQFIDIFSPYVKTNLSFSKGSNGYTLKSQRFVLIEDLKFVFKTLNEPELEYNLEDGNNGYFGKIDVEISTSKIFKLSVFLNIASSIVKSFIIRFSIPTISFYMSTVEVFSSDTNKSEKFTVNERMDFRFSNVKRLKINIPSGSFNFIFYGGKVDLNCKSNKMIINMELKPIENVEIYRTQMAVILQEN